MVTTRRSVGNVNLAYESSSIQGGVDVMNRPLSYEPIPQVTEEVDIAKEKERMQRNLDKLLNYDRNTVGATATVEEKPVETEQKAEINLSDEDIRPSSTTMQFGEDIDQMREEINKVSAANHEESKYRLNAKGKVAVILYSLVVTVVLALIVLNTGVLAVLSDRNTVKAEVLNQTIEKYNAVGKEIDNISSSDYIIDMAENHFGMIKK